MGSRNEKLLPITNRGHVFPSQLWVFSYKGLQGLPTDRMLERDLDFGLVLFQGDIYVFGERHMIMPRYGESGFIPFRSGRFYRHSGDWFFSIRRGVDQGPYNDETRAKKALAAFIQDQLRFERCLVKEVPA